MLQINVDNILMHQKIMATNFIGGPQFSTEFIMPPAIDKARVLCQAPKLDLTVVKSPD